MKKDLILIADGSEKDRLALRNVFGGLCEVIEASDGASAVALAKARAGELEAIFSELSLGEADGYGFIKEACADARLSSVPFIVVTDRVDEEAKAIDAGAWEFIAKPFDGAAVLARFNNIITKKRAVDEIADIAASEERDKVLSYIDIMPLPFVVLKASEGNSEEPSALCIDYANESYCEMTGRGHDVFGKSLGELFPGRELPLKDVYFDVARRRGGITERSVHRRYGDRNYEMFYFSPRPDYCACIVKDVTDSETLKKENLESLMRENKLLSERETEHERYRTVIEQMGALVFEWNSQTKTAYLSSGIDKFDLPENVEPIFSGNYNTSDFVYPDDREKLRKEFFDQLRTRRRHCVTVRFKKKNGAYIWCKVYATSFFNEKGNYLRTFGSIQDINREKVYMEQLRRAVEFDDLTKIYNKNSFYKNTSVMLVDNPDAQFSIIRFDIDRFKVINENFGFAEGNRFLVYIARRLEERLETVSPCVYARMEADIFCVCAPRGEVKELLDFIENIGDGFDIEFDVVPSVGIYNISNLGVPIDVMVDRAKLAMLTVKGNYLIRHAYFDENMHTSLLHEQEIINMMNTALEERQFAVYLQPKFTLGDMKICGAEALARWLHPTKGMIMPGEFIPVFERNGFIMKLDEYIWEQVCILLRSELDRGLDVLPISINISKKDIYNPGLVDIIIGLVQKYEIPVELFQLELTESAYTDNAALLTDIMNRLRSFGFTMMMDDFGSGYSSLNMLKEIPVDVLKLDLRFLADKNGSTGGKGGSIIASVMRMAKWLNLHVITEGIETCDQAEFLRSIGCPDGQGFYFAKPITIEEYEGLLISAEHAAPAKKPDAESSFDLDEIWNPSSKITELFASMFSAIGIYEYGGGNIEAVRVNDRYYDIFGISREDFYYFSIHVRENIAEEDRAKADRLFITAYETGKTAEETIRRFKPDGSVMYVRCSARFLNGDLERGLYFVIVNDITGEVTENMKLREAYERLQESTRRLAAQIK